MCYNPLVYSKIYLIYSTNMTFTELFIIVAHQGWATIMKSVMSVCLCICVCVCLSICVCVCLSVSFTLFSLFVLSVGVFPYIFLSLSRYLS